MPRLLSQRPAVWLALGLGIAYLVTRLINLGTLPMVSDEGTYITWGVRALFATGFEDWLASLEDGKQPLLAWLMPPLLSVMEDRLVAGRLVSVLTGLANVVLLVALGPHLSPRHGYVTGWLAAGLYVVAPIALVHDRMALYDSLVATTSLLVLLTTLHWAERPDSWRTLALGGAMGLAVLTKLSALFFVALVPLVIALLNPGALRRWWLLAQAFLLAAAAYSVLYLSPIVDNIQDGNFQRYSLTASEVLALPWALWLQNLTFTVLIGETYLGWPLALLALGGLLVIARVEGRRGVALALWVLVPLAAFVFTAKIIYSRYVVFCLVGALPAAAWLIVASWRWLVPALGRRFAALPGDARRPGTVLVAGTLSLAIVGPACRFDAGLLADPLTADWFDDRRWITDRFQYVESNYAGYGLREIVAYLREQASVKPIVVMTRATTGMPRDGVTAYLLEWPNVFVGFVPEKEGVRSHVERQPTRALQLASAGADVYYVLTDAPGGEQERLFRSLNPDMSLVMQVEKPGNHSRFQLYRTQWSEPGDDVWLQTPVRYGTDILLRGYNVSARSTHPSGTIRVILYWEATSRPRRDFNVFNHMRDASGTIRGQKDGPPGAGQTPTSRWRPRDLVVDVHQVQVREDAPPGDLEIITGLYDLGTMQRLLVHAPGKPQGDYFSLGTVRITPPQAS